MLRRASKQFDYGIEKLRRGCIFKAGSRGFDDWAIFRVKAEFCLLYLYGGK